MIGGSKVKSIIIISIILLCCVSCTFGIDTGNNNSDQGRGELGLVQNSDVSLRIKCYSPNGENFIVYTATYTDTGEASGEYPEIYVYLNDSTNPIDQIHYSLGSFYSRDSLSLWLDNENILLDATRIYNTQNNKIINLSIPDEEVSDYLISRKGEYAPDPSGQKIAYMILLESGDNQYAQQLYLYDRVSGELEMLCEILNDDWYSMWSFGLIWSDGSIYFNSVTNELSQTMRYNIRDNSLSAVYKNYTIEKISPDQNYCCLSNGNSEIIFDTRNGSEVFKLDLESLLHMSWSHINGTVGYIQEGMLKVYDLKSREKVCSVDITHIESNGQSIQEIYCSNGEFYVEAVDSDTGEKSLYILEIGP